MELDRKINCIHDPSFTVNGCCPKCGYNFTEERIKLESEARLYLEGMVDDLFMDFLFYDRKNCEEMGVDKMRELMDNNIFSKEMMIEVFTKKIKNEY